MKKEQLRRLAIELAGIAAAVAVALLVGSLVVFMISDDPGKAMHALLAKAFSNKFNFGGVLERAIPLIFTGLSVSVIFQARQFSIGAEGQLYAGALAGTLVALFGTSLPPAIHFPLILLAALAAGGLWALIPGWLKARFRANEVVSTLMLNAIMIKFTSFLLADPIRDQESGYTQTVKLADPLLLDRFLPPSRLHTGLWIALMVAVLTYWFLYRTTIGYEIRMVGLNPHFAEYGGINARSALMWAFAFSGLLAGLGGVVEVLGIHHKLIDRFSPGYGFDGILVAILARLHPLAVPVAAFFYAYLQAGAAIMERSSDVPRELVSVVQATLILVVTAEAILSLIRNRFRRRVADA